MARANLKAAISEAFLSGDGLTVSMRIAEEMLSAAAEAKPMDLARVRSLAKIGSQLLELDDEQKGGAS